MEAPEEPGKRGPRFEVAERWLSPLQPSVAIAAIKVEFDQESTDIDSSNSYIEIRLGSNWRYKLWGNLFLWGRKNIPVKLQISAEATPDGSILLARASDTFGPRITDQTFFGAEQTFTDKFEELLSRAAKAAMVESRR